MFAEFYNLSLHFYQVNGASEANITEKASKYHRKLCIVLLQSETVL